MVVSSRNWKESDRNSWQWQHVLPLGEICGEKKVYSISNQDIHFPEYSTLREEILLLKQKCQRGWQGTFFSVPSVFLNFFAKPLQFTDTPKTYNLNGLHVLKIFKNRIEV